MLADELWTAYYGIATAARRDKLLRGCPFYEFGDIANRSLEHWRAMPWQGFADMAKRRLPYVVRAKERFAEIPHTPNTYWALSRLVEVYRGIIEVHEKCVLKIIRK